MFSFGGTYAKDNLQPAHQICNRKRQVLLVKEFKQLTSNQEILKRAIEIIDGYQRIKVKVIKGEEKRNHDGKN